jgi:hypothetical protein
VFGPNGPDGLFTPATTDGGFTDPTIPAGFARFASRGRLNSPWGVARASFAFGRFSGDVLVGNFGDGRINVFDSRGRFLDHRRPQWWDRRSVWHHHPPCPTRISGALKP